MFRVTIMGRDLAEFQENLRDYANVHAGLTGLNVSTTTTLSKDEEYEEVESPYATHIKVPKEANEYYESSKKEDAEYAEVADDKAVSDGELDSEGLPWDDRIHASSKAKVKDGTWRTKRNLDENILFQVRNELKAKRGTAQPTAVIPQAPVATPTLVPVVETPAVTVAPVVTQAAPAMPTMQQSGHTLATFSANFPMILAKLITDGKVTQEYCKSLEEYFGVAQLWMINDEQKAILFDSFIEYGFVTKVG